MYAHHEKYNSSPPYSSVSNPVPCGAMVAVTFPEGGSAVVLFTCPLDSSEVGTGDKFPHPIIRFIPHAHLAETFDVEPSKDYYDRYENNAQIRLTKIEKSLIDDYKI
jgi:hypothetical protein